MTHVSFNMVTLNTEFLVTGRPGSQSCSNMHIGHEQLLEPVSETDLELSCPSPTEYTQLLLKAVTSTDAYHDLERASPIDYRKPITGQHGSRAKVTNLSPRYNPRFHAKTISRPRY